MGQEVMGILLLAFLAEAVTEYFFSEPLNRIKGGEYCFVLKYIACLIGVGLCVGYKIDILNMVAGLQPIHPAIAWVVSGVIVGRGSNFLNDVIDRVRIAAPLRVY